MSSKDAADLSEVFRRVRENYGPSSELDSDRLCAALLADDGLTAKTKDFVREVHQTCSARMGASTKTTLLIAASLAKAALKYRDEPQQWSDFVEQLAAAAKVIVYYLQSRGVMVAGGKEVAQVACTASGGNSDIAIAVTNAVQTAGADGVINIIDEFEAAKNPVTFFSQPASAFEIFDNSVGEILLVNPLILISQDPLDEDRIKEALAVSRDHKRSLLCMATEVAEFVDQQVVLVSADIDRLIDIATLTDAAMLEASDRIERNVFGSADEVRRYGRYLLVFEGDGDVQTVADQVDLLYETMTESDDLDAQELLQTRIASLSTPLVELRIYGSDAVHRAASRYQTSAALYAARQAISHGVLPGGGTAYMQGVRYILDNEQLNSTVFQCWAKALTAPLRALYDGSDEGFSMLVDKLALNEDLAFDAETQLLVSSRHKNAPLDPVDHVVVSLQIASEFAVHFLNE
ncbi:MAG: chaperonin GroEL [Pirellulaceae bacterium]